MSLCPLELDALGLGRSRVGRLGRLRSPHAPQSSNLSRVCGTRNPTFGALGRGASDTLFRRSIHRHFDTSMADARRARCRLWCIHQKTVVGLRDPQTLERFKLWGACGDLNLPCLPTRDSPKPSASSSKGQRDTTVYPGSGHLAV